MNMKKLLFLFLFLSMSYSPLFAEENEDLSDKFYEWLIEFKQLANTKYKIDKNLLDDSFVDVVYKPKIIKLDRNQPEFTETFWDYYNNAVHPLRIKRGKEKFKEQGKLLKEVEKKYNIPQNIILSFWGMETDYGRIKGTTKLIDSLSVLSFDHRRSKFFTNELISALKIMQKNNLKKDEFIGSWAGAFGHFQFMPSTFLNYAVDGDKDGKIDLINSLPDAFYSAGNYLSKMGWDKRYRWGRPVEFNRDNKKIWAVVNTPEWRYISFYSHLGVKTTKGKELPKIHIKARLIAPMGTEGPVFLIYNNFTKIMLWNSSTNYALSVGLLSDALVDNAIGKIERNK